MLKAKLASPKIITDFYEDAEIFITGGSGVVGKALIYKLLRSCNVRRIYLLLRPKKNRSIEQRLEDIRNAKIFQTLRITNPSEFTKLVAIAGDVTVSNLGIKPADVAWMENVSVIFHCAATIRFDEPLNVALKLNVGGTYETLKFAENLEKLKVFMHVSTFFSNPHLTYVEPKVYEAPMDWRICLKLLEHEQLGDFTDILTKKLISGFPNTYTFTKNLAESLVNDFRHSVPVAIFRPSIGSIIYKAQNLIIFAFNEPMPGYPAGFAGVAGLFLGVAAGIVKTVYINTKIPLDVTANDICSKLMIYYAAASANISKRVEVNEVPVYLCSSARQITQPFVQFSTVPERHELFKQNPLLKCFLLPGCHYTNNRLVYIFLVFTQQLLPALLADILSRLAGHKPVMMGIMRKTFTMLNVMNHFTLTKYDSPGYTDFEIMYEHTKGTDFDIIADYEVLRTEEDFTQLLRSMFNFIREDIMKEGPEDLKKARMFFEIKTYIYNGMCLMLIYFVLRSLYYIISNYIYLK